MKYWTGYLTAGIIAAITWALQRLAENFEELVDMVYPYVTRTVLDILAGWSSGVCFCLWQMGALVGGLSFLGSIVLAVVYDRKVVKNQNTTYTITGVAGR